MNGALGTFRGGAIVCWMMLFSLALYAQNNIRITVIDTATHTALADAIVRIQPIDKKAKTDGHTALTDSKGSYTMPYQQPVVVFITYLGYAAILDTIAAPVSKTYYLKQTTANIEDIVVTGQYAPGNTKASVYEVKVYTEKDFRDKGATNLREALQGSLNVDMNQDGVFGSGISLQGISGEGVKVMLDGVPIVGRLDGKLDLSQLNLSNIERVEIVKGPMSAVYGTDAMGGVVNLISKSNQREKFNINLKGYYESVGQYNAELNGGVHIGKSEFYIGGGRNFFGGYSAVDTARHKEWRGKEQYFANAKYVYTTSKFKVGITASFFRELMLDRGNLHPNSTYAFDQHYLTMRPVASIFATVPIKDYSEVNLLLGYSGFIRFFNYYTKDLVTLQEKLRTDEAQDTTFYHTITARGSYTLNSRNKKLSFQLGVDVFQEYLKQLYIANGSQEMGDYAAFGSLRWTPIKDLDIQPALRIAYNTRSNPPLVPSLNIKYDFAKHFSIRASYGLGYRAPYLRELYVDFKDSNHDIIGNPTLKPEKGHTVILSFYYQMNKGGHRFKLTNTGFFNYIYDKIDYLQLDPFSSPIKLQRFNLNKFISAGGEHQAEYNWKRFSATAGVNYNWTQVSLGDNSVQPYSLWSADATLQVSYKIPKIEVSVNAFYKYTGQKILYGLYNTITTGYRQAFHSIDVSLTKNFWKDRIQLSCGGKNLLNVTDIAIIGDVGGIATAHSENRGYTPVSWGRSFFVSLNLHFAQ